MDSFFQKQANNFPKEFIPNIAGYIGNFMQWSEPNGVINKVK